MEKRLYRSRNDRMIWGVCGGLAHYFAIDPTIVRIIFVLLLFANGAGILAYIVLAIVVPLEGSKAREPKETVQENVAEIKETATELGQEIRATFTGVEDKSATSTKTHHRRQLFFGITLLAVGVLLLIGSLNLLSWFRWQFIWPVVIIGIGLLIIFRARGR